MSLSWIKKSSLCEVKKHYPKLVYNANLQTLSGEIDVETTWKGVDLSGVYEIEIKFNPNSQIPFVKEISDKIQVLANKKNRRIDDLHVNKDGTLCLCSRFKAFEKALFFNKELNPILAFIDDLVMSFFSGIIYFETYDTFPFGELPHYNQGLIQEVNEDPQILFKFLEPYSAMYKDESFKFVIDYLRSQNIFLNKKKIGRNESCPCGNQKKYKKCHLPIVQLIQRLFNLDQLKVKLT